MITDPGNLDFDAFIRHLAAQPGEAISVQEALRMWDSREADAAAIQQAIDSYEAGERGRPAEQVMAELKAKLQKQYGL